MDAKRILFRIRCMLVFFMIALVLSGITAFPVYSELRWLLEGGYVTGHSATGRWLNEVWTGVKDSQEKYPFLFYGFDWLAFAHLVIAMLFIGVLKDPIRNKWIIQWAMLACIAIFPLAFIAGPIRGIPWFHILIDCSFGIIGLIPLSIVYRWIGKLEAAHL